MAHQFLHMVHQLGPVDASCSAGVHASLEPEVLQQVLKFSTLLQFLALDPLVSFLVEHLTCQRFPKQDLLDQEAHLERM